MQHYDVIVEFNMFLDSIEKQIYVLKKSTKIKSTNAY